MMLIQQHLENWFRARGFEVLDGVAVTDSGYGSGGISIDIAELEKELAEAVLRRINVELGNLRGEKIVTEHEAGLVFERLRRVFFNPDWMPAAASVRGLGKPD